MARIESVALGGFYKTPTHLIQPIADLIDTEDAVDVTACDPCAGEGEAIKLLTTLLGVKSAIRACELETKRFETLKETIGNWNKPLCGDAFLVEFGTPSVSLLYLNPPYDLDPVHGRLEEKFLERFTRAMIPDGLLVFLVPHYALKASAKTLAREYKDLACYRFPDEDFESYKQVVLIARRAVRRFRADSQIVAQVEAWAESVDGMPVLGTPTEKFKLVDTHYVASATWELREVDIQGLTSKARPWRQTLKAGLISTPHILPDVPVTDLLFRSFPVVTVPRPAHIAAGIASGMFNGKRVSSATPGMPDLLVKGVFRREYETIEERTNKDGDVIAVEQVQKPSLVTTIFDLDARVYRTLKTEGRTEGLETIEDLLHHYGPSLMRVMGEQCPVMYEPARDGASVLLSEHARTLFQAQGDATKALVTLLGGNKASRRERMYKAAILLGEIGCGKCLGLGTLVLKYDGTRVPVEKVRRGDLLMGPDSKPRKVLGTTRGRSELYKVTPVKGEPWVCNDAHILTLVHTMSDEVFDIPAKTYLNSKRLKMTLSKGGRTTHPRTEFKQFFPETGVDFPERGAPPIDPYFLGVWYGDGAKGLDSKNRVAAVRVTTADSAIVDIIAATAVKYNLGITELDIKRCPTYDVTGGQTGGQPNDLLTRLRLVYADGQHLPKACLLGSREVRKAFLAGLLDSDGSLGMSTYDFSQKRKPWAEDVCFLARSLGIRATMSRSVKASQNGTQGVYWRVCLSGDFGDVPLRLKRKVSPPRQTFRRNKRSDPQAGLRRTRHANRTGIEVRSIGVGDYAGFELDGDGRFLLGDFTVTHNTTCALTVGGTIGKRMLVMCPPHLLDSWTDETRALYPHAEVRVLQSISDVDDLANVPKDKFLVAIVSRETAKLGHGWTSVTGACPKCGSKLPHGDLAKKRVRCSVQPMIPTNAWAKRAVAFAYKLMSFKHFHTVEQLLDGRAVQKHLKTATIKDWPGFDKAWVSGLIPKVLAKCAESDTAKALLGQLLVADYSEARIEALVRKLAVDDSWQLNDVARALTLLLKPHSELQTELRSREVFSRGSYYSMTDEPVNATETRGYKSCLGEIHWTDGKLTLDVAAPGSLDMACRILGSLYHMGSFAEGPECGEPLFQAVPTPRRYPLAKYIAKTIPDFFDLFAADEAHEFASDGSAQERAAHRITALGIPTLLLTGSLMNGYAESLFTNLWATSPQFREEFGRHEITRFIERYGYRKRVVSERDAKTKEIVSYGSHTDRVERSERITGDAPGVLPLFLFRHLLKVSVTLHKADLVELPKCHQIRCLIDPSPELKKGYEALLDSLRQQIRKDRFKAGYAGKLFGALAELPSYLDRATLDTGNQDDGSFEIRYPESLGGELVATGASFDSNQLSPKEEWMIETVRAEIAEGRNVMVLGWHVNLLPRLSRILKEALGEEAPILYADKVATGKRQEWISKQIVAKKRRILIANPVCIQTGLNNLVHFSTQIWMENPGANPTIVRQTEGRIFRIGQVKETRIYFPVYKETLQEAMYDLLMRKIAVATSTDGLDPESVLLAAGGGSSSYLTGLSIGKQLWALMKEAA